MLPIKLGILEYKDNESCSVCFVVKDDRKYLHVVDKIASEKNYEFVQVRQVHKDLLRHYELHSLDHSTVVRINRLLQQYCPQAYSDLWSEVYKVVI